MTRKSLDNETRKAIYEKSRRRCALCVGLEFDYSEKLGQIAHLDKKASNNNLDNLCYLCLNHHSIFDSTTSQHSNYTQLEVKNYRNELYWFFENQGFELLETPQKTVTRPYAIKFNGGNGTLLHNLSGEDTSTLTIEAVFKIHNQVFSGVILNLIHTVSNTYLYLRHYSSKHPEKPNKIELLFQQRTAAPHLICSFTINSSKWTKLVLILKGKTVSLSLEKVETEVTLPAEAILPFNLLEIGGATWNNPQYSAELPRPTFLMSYFQYLRILGAESRPIEHAEFSLGREYYRKSITKGKTILRGGCTFPKMII